MLLIDSAPLVSLVLLLSVVSVSKIGCWLSTVESRSMVAFRFGFCPFRTPVPLCPLLDLEVPQLDCLIEPLHVNFSSHFVLLHSYATGLIFLWQTCEPTLL